MFLISILIAGLLLSTVIGLAASKAPDRSFLGWFVGSLFVQLSWWTVSLPVMLFVALSIESGGLVWARNAFSPPLVPLLILGAPSAVLFWRATQR